MKKFAVAAVLILALAGFAVPAAWADEAVYHASAAEFDGEEADELEPLDTANCFTVEFDVTYYDQWSRDMLSMINQMRTGSDAWYRKQDGSIYYAKDLSPLQYDANLEKIAQQRLAEYLLVDAHERPNGGTPWTAFRDYDVRAIGENLCAGTGFNTYVAFDAWSETNRPYAGQGHRRNMLTPNANAVGIACARVDNTYYWVLELGSVSSVTPVAKTEQPRTTPARVEVRNDLVEEGTVSGSLPYWLPLVGTGSTAQLPTLHIQGLRMGDSIFNNSVSGSIVSADWKPAYEGIVSVSNGAVTALMDFFSIRMSTTILGFYYEMWVGFDGGLVIKNYAPGLKIVKVDTTVVPQAGEVRYFKGTPLYWAPGKNGGSWVGVVDNSVTQARTDDFTSGTGTAKIVSRPGTTGSNGIACGDANGNKRINVVDAQIIYDMGRGVYATSAFTEQRWLAADVNNDGVLDASDAYAIQRHAITGAWQI